ncbi:MAG: PHB depolymerase family esterase [Gemmataceae bacterium]
MRRRFRLLFLALFLLPAVARADGRTFEVTYPPSEQKGELQLGVTYTLWVPDGVKTLRGVIVHQHGCGTGACQGGATAAYDLHWQALARKWDCALLGPSYQQQDKQNCRLWCDPRNGSAKTFLRALDELAAQAKHAELARVPWCLWGHSGGGYWASLMGTLYPERIVALWLRSGTAFMSLGKDDGKPEVPEAAYRIPTMCNPGAKENGDKRFNGAWTGSIAMFKAFRAKGAPIGFAPDPRTSHECGDSRYLAIPFFDACLALRLPDRGSKDTTLKPVDPKKGYLADTLLTKAEPASAYRGKTEEAVWLPNEAVAQAWVRYVLYGKGDDTTPPPAPFNVRVRTVRSGEVEVTWDAHADFESGLQAFIVRRGDREIGQVPPKPIGRFGRPLFQTMSYHDTPEKPLPAMRFVDRVTPGENPVYEVIAINGVGLRSKPTRSDAR